MPTLREQLKDPIFRKWFAQAPREKPSAARTPGWFLYVQKDKGGPWKRGEVDSYIQGYKFIAKNLKNYHDMALSHKRQDFKPPVVKDKMTGKRRYHLPEAPGYRWCPFCRRMTKFKYFSNHHAMPKWVDASEKRCNICGVRQGYCPVY